MTKLEEEKKRRKQIAEEEERLDVIGQESDKRAVKWVQEDIKDTKKKIKAKEDAALEELDSKRRWKESYTRKLAEIIFQRLSKQEYPKGYIFRVLISKRGLEIRLKDKKDRWYAKGMYVSGKPELDINAAATLMIQMDNRLAICEGDAQEVNGRIAPINRTKSGLWIPPKKS